jgi:hypothetical protein
MMRFRHAAALALVGWYLMVAPASGKHSDPNHPDFDPINSKFRFHAPLSKWTQIGEFDSATECDRQREKQMTQHGYNLMEYSRGAEITAEGLWVRCIGTDDPRLREK